MYTDEELHKMCDEATKREDVILAGAILAVAVAHEQGKDQDLLAHLLMWTNFHMSHGKPSGEGGYGGQQSLTAIDPDRVINL